MSDDNDGDDDDDESFDAWEVSCGQGFDAVWLAQTLHKQGGCGRTHAVGGLGNCPDGAVFRWRVTVLRLIQQ